jgi:hypothetical protein
LIFLMRFSFPLYGSTESADLFYYDMVASGL